MIGGWFAVLHFKVLNAVNGINLSSILVAFLGAVMLIVIVRMFRGRGS